MAGTQARTLWSIGGPDEPVVCTVSSDCNLVELRVEQHASILLRESFPDRSTAYERARVLRGEHDAALSRRLGEIYLETATCVLRPWRMSDVTSLAEHANNPAIGRNLRDGFPAPFTVDDAVRFISHATSLNPPTRFAIVAQGEAVGSIGFTLHSNVERVSAEIGYWLGERFWGRGITADAVRAVTRFAIAAHGLTRVFAVPYEWNPASFRVLEKAGFVCEGRMRKSAIKDGRVIDQLLYAYVVDDEDVRDRQARDVTTS